MYYDNLPGSGFMPGLTYIGEILFSFGAMILYSITFVITLITKLIIHLLGKDKPSNNYQGNNYQSQNCQNKNYFPKIAIIIATILLFCGVNTFILDFKNDINVVKTYATIVKYTKDEYGHKCPVVQYTVGDKTYEVMVEVFDQEIENSDINDKVEIYYNKKAPSELAYLSYYENVYIPCFLISLTIFVILIIKYFKKNK